MRTRLLIIFTLLVLLLTARFYLYFKDNPGYSDSEQAKFITLLRQEPDIAAGQQKFSVLDKNGTRIYITASTATLYHYGDNLFIDGIFTKKHQRYYIYYPNIQITALEHNYLSKIDVYIKNTSKKIYNSSIPLVPSALLLGIVFGGRQGMPQAFLDQLRTTGVIHVIAASGMNVTMVAAVLVALFGKIFRRQLVLLFSVTGVAFYAFLAGFEPSIVRAAIMAVIALCAGLLGRQYLARFSLFITGLLMLFYRPVDLFDIGFQLSFLSTWGILELKPLLPFRDFFLGDDIGTTLAAQIAAFPVLISAFGQYGVLSLLVNVLVLWTIPFLMVFGALGLIAGIIIFPLGKIFIWLAWPFLIYFERVVGFFASLNWTWQTPGLSWEFIAGYYLILLAVVMFFKQKARQTGV